MNNQPAPPLRTSLRWFVLAVVLLGVVGFYALGGHEYLSFDAVRANLDAIKARVEDNLLFAAVFFFLLYTAMTALSVPAAWILSLLAGALFGRVLGVGVALSAATCGATLAFLSSRFVLRDWVQGRFGQYLETINRGIERDGAFYLFSLRLAPFIPFFAINLCMGLTPMRTWTYAWVSLVGMLPGALLYVNAGTELRRLQRPSDILTPTFMLSFIALGLAPLVFRKSISWWQDRKRNDPP
jgi:uncharacterized membrane protein YdjX (TVP38/TMEM64 family)